MKIKISQKSLERIFKTKKIDIKTGIQKLKIFQTSGKKITVNLDKDSKSSM